MNSGEAPEKKEDPIKLHREGTALTDAGKHEEAIEKFLQASELYRKVRNFFDASYALFKAAEGNYILKDYKTASERFLEAADLAFEVSYDRFGLSALEYALDCYKATEEKKKAKKLEKRIKELKSKLATM